MKNVSFSHICLTKLNFPFLARRAVAFGTTLDRELLPLKVPANRFGNELALRGAPNRGPGCYYNAEVVGKNLFLGQFSISLKTADLVGKVSGSMSA